MRAPDMKIEVFMSPEDNKYFWCILAYSDTNKKWYNTGQCGWEKTPAVAWEVASRVFIERFGNIR